MKKIILLSLILCVSVANAAQVIDERLIPSTIPRSSQLIPTGETNAVCIGNTPGVSPSITLCSSIDLTGKTLLFKLPEYTIANLPASHPLSIVTNGADGSDCVKGGGTSRVLCAWNGSAWASIGGGTGTDTGDVTEVQGTTNEICMTNGTGPIPIVQLCSTIVTDGKTLRVGRFEMTGDISPTAIAAQADDWNPTGLSDASTVRITSTGPQSISGLQTGTDGRILTLHNVGTSVVTLLNDSSSSAASDRFLFGVNVPLSPNQSVMIQYDATTTNRWRLIGGIGSSDNYCADQGANDTYACNLSPAITAYTTGKHYFFKANTANTTAATLAFNGLSNITIKKAIGGITTDLATNDIRVGQIVEVVYDGTNFQMLSMLGNSPLGISGGTVNAIPKYDTTTTITPSGVAEDANNTTFTKPPIFGDCATDCLTEDRTAITGAKTQYYPNHTGWLGVYPNSRKAMAVELFDPATDVSSGTGKVFVRVPTSLNTMNLVAIKANTIVTGTTGPTSVQITRCAAVTGAAAPCTGATVTMLTTVVSVDSTESDSDGAGTSPVIKANGDQTVSTNQMLRFDVTAVSGTAPKGLTILTEWELP